MLRRAWPLALALIVITAIASGLLVSKHGRVALLSAVLLPDLLVELPVRPVTWLTPDPIVERVFIDYGSGRILADIYRPPGDDRYPAIVFSMGAPPMNLDHPRLVRLGEDAARAGAVMVIPFSNRLNAEQIDPEELEALVGVFRYTAQRPYVDAERVGFAGVSVGASLALVAAADERIAGRVDFIVSFGGYFDGLDLLEAIGARRVVYDGLEEEWEPDPHTVRVLARQLIAELPDRGDRSLLTEAFVRRRPVDAARLAELSPQGRASYDVLAGEAEGTEASGRLPALALAEMEFLSPSRIVDQLPGELFILHDRTDDLIPYVESRRLADALAGREGVHFTEVSLFEHVHPRLSQGGDVLVREGVRLAFRLYQLMLRLS